MLKLQACEIQERKSSCIGVECSSVEHSGEFSRRLGPVDIAPERASLQLTRNIGPELEPGFQDDTVSGFGTADSSPVVSA